MKVVKFKDGTYGIRHFTIFGYMFFDFVHRYFGLKNHLFNTPKNFRVDKIHAKKVYAYLTDMGK